MVAQDQVGACVTSWYSV
ncbi:hypothetical protein IEO21_11031 [Rhodonia placenta]|uniref:Uncharacterized protein n=1 Tax=Rhodonia placenta TaxID=104341 RepID=A0A8H7TWS3_9APHY|nr:hypothetical protein IEO21_11031 [Postia placenta]